MAAACLLVPLMVRPSHVTAASTSTSCEPQELSPRADSSRPAAAQAEAVRTSYTVSYTLVTGHGVGLHDCNDVDWTTMTMTLSLCGSDERGFSIARRL